MESVSSFSNVDSSNWLCFLSDSRTLKWQWVLLTSRRVTFGLKLTTHPRYTNFIPTIMYLRKWENLNKSIVLISHGELKSVITFLVYLYMYILIFVCLKLYMTLLLTSSRYLIVVNNALLPVYYYYNYKYLIMLHANPS